MSRPLKGRHECWQCGHHEFKTYHFQLDQDGTIIVSTAIWDRLQTMFDNGGFEKVNVVAKPPSQTIELPTAKLKLTTGEM